MLPQVGIIPVKLNLHLSETDKVPMPQLRCLRCNDVHLLHSEMAPFQYSHNQSVMIHSYYECDISFRYILISHGRYTKEYASIQVQCSKICGYYEILQCLRTREANNV